MYLHCANIMSALLDWITQVRLVRTRVVKFFEKGKFSNSNFFRVEIFITKILSGNKINSAQFYTHSMQFFYIFQINILPAVAIAAMAIKYVEGHSLIHHHCKSQWEVYFIYEAPISYINKEIAINCLLHSHQFTQYFFES